MSEYFVSPTGDDETADGSMQKPYGTITSAAKHLEPGDRLLLLTGTFYEHAVIEGVGEFGAAHIVVTAAPGHRATIDGALRDFIEHPELAWRLVQPGEYESLVRLPLNTDRGAFVRGRPTYTRLVTYDLPQDFRAHNQKFGKLPAEVLDPPGSVVKDPKYPRRPWVYMGPGLWQEDNGQEDDGRLHVRLSHTSLTAADLHDEQLRREEYLGPTDPTTEPLAIWGGEPATDATLTIQDCFGIEVRGLTIQHGAATILVRRSTGVILDRLVVNAGNYGIELGEHCDDSRITDTVVDGGMPPWMFRSDRKDDYEFPDGTFNSLGARTSRVLIALDPSSRRVWIEQCEFVNGHDLQLAGSDVTFTKNWINNLNDDAIFIGVVSYNMRILGNVIERCLTAVSTATNSPFGDVYIHRNLIDLRRPTLGRRPHPIPDLIPVDDEDERDALEPARYGNLLKDGALDPELSLSHNTVLLVDQPRKSPHTIFRTYTGQTVRRSYNNIFLVINKTGATDRPIAFLPPQPTGQCETDGNSYFRIGEQSPDLFHVRAAKYLKFASISDLTDTKNAYFLASKTAHPPGFEKNGIDQHPRLAFYSPPPEFPGVEDFRLTELSPARHHGVSLEDKLPDLGDPLPDGAPDIGCYPFEAAPLHVGVGGRKVFPGSGVTTPVGASPE